MLVGGGRCYGTTGMDLVHMPTFLSDHQLKELVWLKAQQSHKDLNILTDRSTLNTTDLK